MNFTPAEVEHRNEPNDRGSAPQNPGLGEPPPLTAASDQRGQSIEPADESILLDAGLSSDELAGASGPAAPPFVYAIGQIEARYPSLSIEKEFQHRLQGELRRLI